jgi:tRNA A37 N6-isopentenylltransferase MiaA
MTAKEAQTQITTRTRQLARRQLRWFDKLTRTLSASTELSTSAGLPANTEITVAESPTEIDIDSIVCMIQ